MTPDEHAARARDLLRTADEILTQAIDENTGRPFKNPMVHQQVQTLALLAQVHATLSLHQPALPPSSADAALPSSGVPNRGRIVAAPTRQPAPEPSAFTRWQRLSDADVADFGLSDDGDAAAERDLLNTEGIDNGLPTWTKPQMARSNTRTTTRSRRVSPRCIPRDDDDLQE